MRKSFSNLLKIRVLLIFLSANIERLFKKICFRLQLEWVRWLFVMTWFSGAGLSAWKSVQPHQYQRNTTITSSSLRDPHHYQNNITILTTSLSEHCTNHPPACRYPCWPPGSPLLKDLESSQSSQLSGTSTDCLKYNGFITFRDVSLIVLIALFQGYCWAGRKGN